MGKIQYKEIDELCTIEKGITGLAKATPGKYPLVATGADRRSCVDYQFDTKAVCIPLVSSTGHGKKSLNYVHYQEGKFAVGTILAAVIPKDENELNPKYLHLYLSFFKDSILVPLMKGAANVSLSIKDIKKVKIPLPSIETQNEIIDKYYRIKPQHEKLSSEIDHQLLILKQLRQSILQVAIEGKLTAQWQKENPDLISGENSAEKLLENIKAEKEKLIAEGKIKKQKPLPLITDEKKLFELPEGWKWCRLGEIAELITKGSSPSWQGISYVEQGKGIRFITSKNVYEYYLDLSKETFVEEKFNDIEPRSILKKGDLLTNIVGASIGRTAIYDLNENANINQAVCLIRYSHTYLLKDYLLYWMNSKWLIDKMHEDEFAPGRANLSMTNVANFPVPFPPKFEQIQLLEKLKQLFVSVNNLEKIIIDNNNKSELLIQTVLKESFEP